MLAKANQQLTKINQQLNRAHMQKNRLLARQKAMQNTSRKMRTRTLIQLGGLLEKANLLEAFDIQTGVDLQHPDMLHKAATLLGFLKTIENEYTFSDAQMSHFQTLGETVLKAGK